VKPRALIFWGGWDGHKPDQVAQILGDELRKHDFDVQVETTLDCLNDAEALKQYTLIIPCWTMGKIEPAQCKALCDAVKSGVGLGGVHGGTGDAFRGNVDYDWMVGGIFLAHPHIGDYTVRIKDYITPITKGLPTIFPYRSEQYYMMYEPSIQVLADTEYVHEGRAMTMPVSWVKMWGKGRIFYSALGHDPAEFSQFPEALTLTIRGLLWAAGKL